MRLRNLLSALGVAIVLFTLPHAISGQTTIAPPEIPGETYFAAAPMSITLDGNTSDWAGVPYASMNRGPLTTGQPISARFAAAADSSTLYVSVLVSDSSIITGRHGDDYWNEDSVEVYLNTNQNHQMTRYTPAVVQITVPAVNIGTPIAHTIIAGQNVELIGARAVVTRTSSGYAVELSVPLRNVYWNINTNEGSSIGFQVQVNSASSRDRDYKLSWSAQDQTSDVSYYNPSVFGELTFAEPVRQPSRRPLCARPPL
ncbi:MAG: sugar-binding protein [Anaerolineae bacterium]